ncbi:MAG: hypothetical protein ACFFD2_23405 [Promethearchaeota archaeon]
MRIKGIGFLQIKEQIIYEFSRARWNDFFKKFKTDHPEFNKNILLITNISMESFLAFANAIANEFYNNDKKVFWRFGSLSAKVSFSEGGLFYTYLRHKQTLENFVNYILPHIWNNFFDEGREKFTLDENVLNIYLVGLQKYYFYIEYTVMGFIEKSLELIGIKVKETIRIKSSSEEIHYKFILDL